MRKKEHNYMIIRLAISFFIAAVMGFAIITRNMIGAVIILFSGLFLFVYIKRRYKDVVIADERTQQISGKAIAGAFWIYIICIVLANIAVIFLEPLNLEIIDRIKPAVYHITYTFFFLIFLYEALKYYYTNKM